MCIHEYLYYRNLITNFNSKISRAICPTKHVKRVILYKSIITLNYVIIQPPLYYGILAWGNASHLFTKTVIWGKGALGNTHNASYNSHTQPLTLFKSVGILKLTDLYEYQTLLFMYHYCNNKLPQHSARYIKSNLSFKSLPQNANLCLFILNNGVLYSHRTFHCTTFKIFETNTRFRYI